MTGQNGEKLLVLGTAQLGMAYGRQVADPGEPAALRLLDIAWELGIRWLDTAPAYGAAEERIGKWSASRNHRFGLITKLTLPPHIRDQEVEKAVAASVRASLNRLGGQSVDMILTHSAQPATRTAVHAAFDSLKKEELIGGWGASVYTSGEADQILAVGRPDMLQVPLSLMNPRVANAGIPGKAAARGTKVHARSILWQGMYMLNAGELPPHLEAAAPALREIHALAADSGLDPLDFAIRAVLSQPGIEGIVIGADNEYQLQSVAHAFEGGPLPRQAAEAAFRAAAMLPESVADPRHWPKTVGGTALA